MVSINNVIFYVKRPLLWRNLISGPDAGKQILFFLSDCIYETFQRSKIESFVFHLILLSEPPTGSTARPRISSHYRGNPVIPSAGLILLMVTLPFSGSQHSVLLAERRARTCLSYHCLLGKHAATCYPRQQMAVSLLISSGFCLLAPFLFFFFSFFPPSTGYAAI